ncbi:MAG: class I SAM-dependent methyltransferase [Nanoarchaeota archaeon]
MALRKLKANLSRIVRDLYILIYHFKNIDFSNLRIYLKFRYFLKEWKLEKIESASYFFIVNFSIFRKRFVNNILKKYWDEFRCFEEIIKVIEQKGMNKKSKVLDIGCGYISVLNILSFGEKYGLDIILNYLSVNKIKVEEDVNWVNGSGEKIPMKNNSLDIVFSSNSLDHMENPYLCIEEIYRVLKENGLVILIVDIFEENKRFRNFKHPNSFTKEHLIEYLDDFKILKMKYTTGKKSLHFKKYFWSKLINKNIQSLDGYPKEMLIIAEKVSS